MSKVKYLIVFCVLSVLILTSCGLTNNINQDELHTNNRDDIQNNELIEPSLDEEELEIFFINVGKADCIFIKLGDKSFLIDTGSKDSLNQVLYVLKAYEVETLDGILLTHTHKDHIGGLSGILSAYDVKEVYAGEITEYKNGKNAVDEELAKQGRHATRLKAGDSFSLNGAIFTVIGPLEKDEEDDNNNSVVVVLEYGEDKVLFTGDAEFQEETSLLKAGVVPESTVLKVGNHGEKDASSISFINAVKPSVSVISTSTKEEPDTPDVNVVNNLEQIGSDVYVTQEAKLGVLIRTKGNGISVSVVDNLKSEEVVKDIKIANLDKKAEKLVLTNEGNKDVDISGWYIFSDKGNEMFFFPEGTIIKAGSELSVVSGKNPPDGDIFWNESDVWHDSKKDKAILYDAYGRVVDTE